MHRENDLSEEWSGVLKGQMSTTSLHGAPGITKPRALSSEHMIADASLLDSN